MKNRSANKLNYKKEIITSPRTAIVHLVTISLPAAKVHLNSLRRTFTPDDFCRKYDLDVAINANFYQPSLQPLGIYIANGKALSGYHHNDYSLFFDLQGRAAIAPSQNITSSVFNAISGVLIANQGKVTMPNRNRYNLSLIGLSQNCKTLFLCVVDSNSWNSAGLSVMEGAAYLLSKGAWQVLQMDGGSSSLLGTAAGILNQPSTRILGGRATIPWVKPVPTMIGFRL